MMRIAVCDDEKMMRDQLCQMIGAFLDAKGIQGHIIPVSDGRTLLEAGDFDVIFLDIQMRGMDGMETARLLRERGDKGFLVFVTVLEEYVFDAFQVDASDYLVKPVNPERFASAMARACKWWREKKSGLAVRTKNWRRFFRFEELLYCEVMGRKIYLHTASETVDYYERLTILEEQLGGRFFKCHRSFLVNLDHVCGYADGMAEMDNGERIPVSRLRGQAFTEAVLRRMRGNGR